MTHIKEIILLAGKQLGTKMRSDSDNYVEKYSYHFIEHIWRKDAKRMEFQFQIGRSGNTYTRQ